MLAWGVRDLVHAVEGGEEAVTLALPVGGAGLEAEDVAEEIVRRRVLVEAADEIGDGAVEIFGADDRRVQEEPARAGLHGAGLVVGHPLEHLELDEVSPPPPPPRPPG